MNGWMTAPTKEAHVDLFMSLCPSYIFLSLNLYFIALLICFGDDIAQSSRDMPLLHSRRRGASKANLG